jgi:hypothetical protein
MNRIGFCTFVAVAFLLSGVPEVNAQNGASATRRGGIPGRSESTILAHTPAPPAMPVAARERTVSSVGIRRLVPSQYATIQAAIDSAKSGDTVLVSEKTYLENIRFRGKAITVASLYLLDGDTSHIRKTVIDGSGATNPDSGSVVSFVNGEDTTSILCGFTITRGTGTNYIYNYNGQMIGTRGGGGIFGNLSGPRIVNNVITKNRIVAPVGTGGGVEVLGSVSVTPFVILEKNRIVENSVTGTIATGDLNWSYSGGIDITGANGRVQNNVFESDTVTGSDGVASGGMYFGRYANAPLVTGLIAGNVFRSNVLRSTRFGAVGAGLLIASTGDVTVADNLFEGNSAFSTGSGTWAQAGGLGVDDESTASTGRKLIRNNRFVNNTIGNIGLNDGGGVELWETVATLSSNLFQGNSVTGVGAGANNTPGGGAGVSAYATSFRMENNIFVKNASAKDGAGVLVSLIPHSGTEQVMVNNTFSGNQADGVGGAARVYYTANFVMMNNILWGDVGKMGGNEIAYDGNLAAVAYSDIQGGWTPGTGIIHADPMFADTTMKLSPGSPCLGRGRDSMQVEGIWYKAPKTDHSGWVRPDPAGSFPDMGAMESPLRETVRRNVPGQYATIQAAIDASAHGDTVLVSENTYKENIRFRGKRITVGSLYLMDRDTTHIPKTIIDGSASTNPDSGSTVYFVNGEDTSSVLCGFTIQGGTGTTCLYTGTTAFVVRSGGGIFCNLAGARIVKNVITRNRVVASSSWGGGMDALGSASVTPVVIVEGNRIIDNSVESKSSNMNDWGNAGGVDFTGVNGRIANNVFERDSAIGATGAVGGGLSVAFSSVTAPLLTVPITGNVFRANVAKGVNRGAVGGGVFVEGTSDMIIADNLFDGNSAMSATGWAIGGGMCVDDQDQATCGRKLIDHNRFINNTVACNAENHGGGLSLWKTVAAVSRNTFTGNSVAGLGKGDDNGPGGGAGFSAYRSSFWIENNLFLKNRSAVDAAGMLISFPPWFGAQQVIINNTLAVNQADGVGGAIRLYLAPSTVLLNTVCWKDSGRYGGNEIAEDGGFAAVANCDIRGGWASGAAILNIDPLFADSTTLVLSPSSKCIGRGADSLQIGGVWYKAPLLDIYGNPRGRPVGTHVDIGAVEELTVDVPAAKGSLPTTFVLEQNYPNPFNPSTMVSVQLPVAGQARLEVYNLLGQRVAVLMDEKKDPGSYLIRWNAAGFPSGIYFYRLEAGEFRDVKKMVLLK